MIFQCKILCVSVRNRDNCDNKTYKKSLFDYEHDKNISKYNVLYSNSQSFLKFAFSFTEKCNKFLHKVILGQFLISSFSTALEISEDRLLTCK